MHFQLCCRGGLEGKLESRQGLLGVPLDGEDTLSPGHLHEIVSRMGCCHELGQSWVPEDGVIREANAGDVEVDELGAVVVARAEGHGRRICPRERAEPPPTPEKGLLGRSRSSGT